MGCHLVLQHGLLYLDHLLAQFMSRSLTVWKSRALLCQLEETLGLSRLMHRFYRMSEQNDFLLRKVQRSCVFCCVTLNNIGSMFKKTKQKPKKPHKKTHKTTWCSYQKAKALISDLRLH